MCSWSRNADQPYTFGGATALVFSVISLIARPLHPLGNFMPPFTGVSCGAPLFCPEVFDEFVGGLGLHLGPAIFFHRGNQDLGIGHPPQPLAKVIKTRVKRAGFRAQHRSEEIDLLAQCDDGFAPAMHPLDVRRSRPPPALVRTSRGTLEGGVQGRG